MKDLKPGGPAKNIAVVGGGPSGMTVALLLSKLGYKVTIFEKAEVIGGLWASRMDAHGFFEGENSCKVYQGTYLTTPALFELIGANWEHHFVPRHDLKQEWIKPFISSGSGHDKIKLLSAFLWHVSGLKSFRKVSVGEFLNQYNFSNPFKEWMRATALGGITGTMQMTMWELFHRFRHNLSSLFFSKSDQLYWNAGPPNAPSGFITRWGNQLLRQGVQINTNCEIKALSVSAGNNGQHLQIHTSTGSGFNADAVFLSLPPPALSRLLRKSHPTIVRGWGHAAGKLWEVLEASVYQHVGICWFFDRSFQNDLPLGGHGVRQGWYPIMVQFSQYQQYLRPPAETVVIGSVNLNTDFKHHRLGTLASDYQLQELSGIIWEDEQLADPTLPDPIAVKIYGKSSATQIVKYGPLPVKNSYLPLFLATSLNGKSPYFTASLESAIQAGNAAARAFDHRALRLPT